MKNRDILHNINAANKDNYIAAHLESKNLLVRSFKSLTDVSVDFGQ